MCKCKIPGCGYEGLHNGGNLLKHIQKQHTPEELEGFEAESHNLTVVDLLRTKKRIQSLPKIDSARGHAALAIRTLLRCEPFSTVTSPVELEYAHQVSTAVRGKGMYFLPSLEAHKQHQLLVYQYFREHIHKKIRAAMDSIGAFPLALQFDLWSDKLMRPFGALMFSVIDENWTMKSRCLSCRHFKKKHTGFEIKAWILRELGTPTPLTMRSQTSCFAPYAACASTPRRVGHQPGFSRLHDNS